MKSKTFLTAGLTTIALLSAFPTITVLATPYSDSTFITSADTINVSPRYQFIQSAAISVHPNNSETTYILDIRGISEVTSISGTATLYKENSSGNYVKIDSEKLSFHGSTADYTGYLKSDGPGKYKIEFVGTVYANSGTESVTFRNISSY